MTDPIHSTHPDASDDADTDDWLLSLAGHHTDTSIEDSAIRQAILGYHQRQNESSLASASLLSDDHAWQRMRFRLKREGLLAAQRQTWHIWAPAAMAAAVVLAVVMVPSLWQSQLPSPVVVSYADPPTLRSVSGIATQTMTDPLKTAQQIAARLHSFDPSVKLYWYEGVATLDFDVQPEQISDMLALLKPTHPQVVLRPGWNRVVLTQPSQHP